MLDIPAIMQLSGGVARWCNDIGDQVVDPEVIIGVSSRLAIDLRGDIDPDAGDSLPAYPIAAFAGVVSWYVAIDNDYDKTTVPKLLGLTGISVATVGTKTMLYVALPSTAHAGLIAAVAAAGSVSLKADIGGLTGDADTRFIATGFTITVRNRVWIPDGTPATVPDPPEYFTSAQVLALVAAGLDAEFSADGVSWHDTQTTGDDRFHVRFASAEGDWSPAILLPAGATGAPGEDGDTPAIDPVTKRWIIGGVDSGIVAEGQDGADGAPGAPGADGIGLPAVTVADAGKVATVDEAGLWIAEDPPEGGSGPALSDAAPAALADTATPGTAVTAARADHAHPNTGLVKSSEKGAANGVAGLGADGKVPAAQLPTIPDSGPALSDANPAALAAAAAPGESPDAARADHVHPTTGLATLVDGKVPSAQLPTVITAAEARKIAKKQALIFG